MRGAGFARVSAWAGAHAVSIYFLSFFIFVTALIVSFVATPLFINIAHRKGVVDKPGPRRVNVRPVARMGGPAMFFGFLFAMCIGIGRVDNLPYILIGAAIIVITGVVDDVRSLKPGPKLLGQIAAALLMYFTGTRVEFLTNPLGGYFYIAGWFSCLLTVLWIVGMTNTLNLIDGLDGLAAGITLIASVTFFLVGITKGETGGALLAAALVGVTSGFLRWNFYPAKTFMGDSGALFLGFTVSVVALNGAFKSTAILTFLIPVLALGVPIFDTSFAIVRRLKSGQPVMSTPDKGHVHHRLLAAGWHHRDAVILIYIITLALSCVALLLIQAWLLTLYLLASIVFLTVLLIFLGKLKKGKPK